MEKLELDSLVEDILSGNIAITPPASSRGARGGGGGGTPTPRQADRQTPPTDRTPMSAGRDGMSFPREQLYEELGMRADTPPQSRGGRAAAQHRYAPATDDVTPDRNEHSSPARGQDMSGYGRAENVRRYSTTKAVAKDGTTPAYRRMVLWTERRKARIHQLQAEADRKEMEECSFEPQLSAYYGGHHTHGSGGGRSSSPTSCQSSSLYLDNPWGHDTFVHRHEDARRRREEEAARVEAATSVRTDKWRNRVTEPVEFNFGQKVHRDIPSLAKPLRTTPVKARGDAASTANTSRSTSTAPLPPNGTFSMACSVSLLHQAQAPVYH